MTCTSIASPDSRITLLMTEPRVELAPARPPAGAEHELGGVLARGRTSTSAAADVVADDLVVRRRRAPRGARAARSSALGGRRRRARRRRARGRRAARPARAAPCGRRGGSSRSPSGRAGERDDDALARLPGPVDAVRARGTPRAPRRPGRRPTAARARAARRGCPAGSSWRARRRPSPAGRCCRAPCGGAAPRASCRRARSGRRARTTASGIVSLLLDRR